jgi:TetR/AcrR family transcriptional regulator, transcriptional repressor of bet genes
MTRKDLREARRIQLLEATISSIAYNGFAKTTLNGVAKAAKLPPSLLRFYFRNKKELLVETLRHMALEYEASWRERVYRQTTPVARLDAMVDADFDPIMADRDGAIVWYGFWRESQWRPELLHICEKLSNAYYEQTWTAMRQIAEEGGHRDIDPAELAHAFNALINGLWIEILTNPKACDVELAKRACRSFLARAFPKEFGAAKALSSAA